MPDTVQTVDDALTRKIQWVEAAEEATQDMADTRNKVMDAEPAPAAEPVAEQPDTTQDAMPVPDKEPEGGDKPDDKPDDKGEEPDGAEKTVPRAALHEARERERRTKQELDQDRMAVNEPLTALAASSPITTVAVSDADNSGNLLIQFPTPLRRLFQPGDQLRRAHDAPARSVACRAA